MAKQWRITVHPLATDELRAMKRQRPDEFEEVEEVMTCLAMEADPRRPKNRRLSVVALKWDAPGWYRVRSFRLNLRVVFRVLERDGDGRIIELGQWQAVDCAAPEHALQITQAAKRANAYGPELRQRRKKAA